MPPVSSPATEATTLDVGARRLPSLGTVVAAYWVIASVWIVVSDLVLFRNKGHSFADNAASIGKGILFVTVTALLLHLALGRRQRVLDDARRREEQLRQRLEGVTRLESLGRMAGAVAHDYNNLLTVMRGHLDLLRAKALPGQEHHLDALHDALERAVATTSELQVVAKQRDLHLETHDLCEVLDAFVLLISPSLPSGIDLHCTSGPGELPVRVDLRRLEQVLLNLVQNAVDAMPAGGTITVTTGTRAQRVVLTVADTGEGMTEEQRRHCFEPFFTTKPDGKGTGLGLSISYGIVQQHGGEMEVSSYPGRGSTFIITLPLALPPTRTTG